MVFGTDPYIERAKTHIESGDPGRLIYAGLELRFALEQFTYEKLRLRLDKVTIEEIGAWQPRRAIDSLMELVDEHLGSDAVIRIVRETEYGKPAEEGFVTLGRQKGVSPRELGKHWQKLGSFLHVPVPKKKNQTPPPLNESALRTFLNEVIAYIEAITSTRFDSHFSPTLTFTCDKCGQSIVRNSNLLKDKDIVQCQNEQCDASFIAHLKDGTYEIEPYQIELDCRSCGKKAYIEANVFRKMKTDEGRKYVCDKCGARHLVRWLIHYRLEEETERRDE